MRFTVSPEQHKFFQTKGYLEVEDLLDEKDTSLLTFEIGAVRSKSPGYPAENLFRSIPLVIHLIKKKGWGQIASELLHRKPLRVSYDKFYTCFPCLSEPLDKDSCGIYIDLKTRKGCFFKEIDALKTLYNSSGNCYFLIVLTHRFLPNQLNPIIVN